MSVRCSGMWGMRNSLSIRMRSKWFINQVPDRKTEINSILNPFLSRVSKNFGKNVRGTDQPELDSDTVHGACARSILNTFLRSSKTPILPQIRNNLRPPLCLFRKYFPGFASEFLVYLRCFPDKMLLNSSFISSKIIFTFAVHVSRAAHLSVTDHKYI